MSTAETGEIREISLLDIMNGAIAERVNYELEKVARNMLDLNTDAKRARGLTIKISLTPADDRSSAAVKVAVSSTLAPVKSLDGMLLLGGSAEDPTIMEFTRQTPGQLNLAGGEQADPKIIKLARDA